MNARVSAVLIAKIGGDEFAPLLADSGAGEATAVVRALQRLIEASAPALGDGTSRSISISAGFGVIDKHTIRHERALAVADHATYQNKRAGSIQYDRPTGGGN